MFLDELLSHHDIDYIKWDMNRNITNLGNGSAYLETQMQSHQYMLGLYELVSYLTEKHNHILFESCSGGGGRNDLGMMRYFPQVWASDNTDAIALFTNSIRLILSLSNHFYGGSCVSSTKSSDGTNDTIGNSWSRGNDGKSGL